MSFPVAPLDRRFLARRKAAGSCVVLLGAGDAAPARLMQSDSRGARLRFLAPGKRPNETMLVVLENGDVLPAAPRWRIGDVIGVERLPSTPERMNAFRRDVAA